MLSIFRRMIARLRGPTAFEQGVVQSLDNISKILSDKLEAVISGVENQSSTLNDKLEAIFQGVDNQSKALNNKLEAVILGMDNQSKSVDEKFNVLVSGMDNQSWALNERLKAIIVGLDNQSRISGLADTATSPQGAHRVVGIRPLADIAFASVDLSASGNPLDAILASPEFPETVRFFAENPATDRSLMSPDSQALLFTVVRNLRPADVIEIGTFRAGTSEALCRALHANGSGTLHTVDPFGAETVPAILAQWPIELRQRVKFYPIDSIAFFAQMTELRMRTPLAFIDGNHEYEFAAFDIQAASRLLTAGGLIFVDDVHQPGPFFAARDFLQRQIGWSECGDCAANYRPDRPFDMSRTGITNTAFCVLRSPSSLLIGSRPVSTGLLPWMSAEARGVRLTLERESGPMSGTLYAQCILRGFGEQLAEVMGQSKLSLLGAKDEIDIAFASPVKVGGSYDRFSYEILLTWDGQCSLRLRAPPTPY